MLCFCIHSYMREPDKPKTIFTSVTDDKLENSNDLYITFSFLFLYSKT